MVVRISFAGLIAMLLVLLVPGAARAQGTVPVTSTVRLGDVPDVVTPSLQLVVPQCGYCGGAGGAMVVPALPDMSRAPSQVIVDVAAWVSTLIGNRLTDLRCSLLSALQHVANGVQDGFTAVVVALNVVGRLSVLMVVYVQVLISSVWLGFAEMRLLLWAIYQIVLGIQNQLAGNMQTVGAVPGALFAALVAIVRVAGFALGVVGDNLMQVTAAAQGDSVPAIIADPHELYSFVRGVQDALNDHPMTGWAVSLGIAMSYLSTLWIVPKVLKR